jgi:hypothetical protein
MYLFEAIDAIRQRALEFQTPDGTGLWSIILTQIKRDSCFDGSHAETLLEMIGAFVKELDDASVVSLWLATDTGAADEADVESLYPDSVRMDLQMELLDQIIKLAYEEGRAEVIPVARPRKDGGMAATRANNVGNMKMAKYTARQGQYLAFLHYYTKIHGQAPSEAEMQQHFRVTPPTVHSMVLMLEKKGLIARTPGAARSIRVLLPREQLPELD